MDDANFDYREVTEEEERLNYNRTVECPHCKKPIPSDATMCFYCGEEALRHKNPRWIVWTAVFLLITFILFYIIVR